MTNQNTLVERAKTLAELVPKDPSFLKRAKKEQKIVPVSKLKKLEYVGAGSVFIIKGQEVELATGDVLELEPEVYVELRRQFPYVFKFVD